MGSVVAEKLRLQGLDVTLVTPAPLVSARTVNTLEQMCIPNWIGSHGAMRFRSCGRTPSWGNGSDRTWLRCWATVTQPQLASQSGVGRPCSIGVGQEPCNHEVC
jgi:hypothetical protein